MGSWAQARRMAQCLRGWGRVSLGGSQCLPLLSNQRDQAVCWGGRRKWTRVWGVWTPWVLCLVAQSCPTPPPHGVSRQAPLSLRILQARILEWVAMPSSRGSSQPRDWTQVSRTASDSSPSEPPGKPSMNSMPCELETHGDISCWHQNLWCCGDLCLSSKDFFIKLSSSGWRKRMHMDCSGLGVLLNVGDRMAKRKG